MPFKLLGYDTFEDTADSFYSFDGDAEYATLKDAYAAAHDRFVELERTQPSASSGGQDGIQDEVFVVYPTGTRERVFPDEVGLGPKWSETTTQ